jgi:DNA-directed RNA polymerase specialized sigma24 family protein
VAAKEIDPLDELVRLQVLQLRRSAGSQTELIIELGKAGFQQARIADLVGTTPATVKVTLQRAKSPRSPRKAAATPEGDA